MEQSVRERLVSVSNAPLENILVLSLLHVPAVQLEHMLLLAKVYVKLV